MLLHLPVASDVDLRQCISCLTDGLKLWACYLLAHKTYLEKNYSGSLAIAELALSMSLKLYPGMRHEILNEKGKQGVWEDLVEYIAED